MLTVIRGDSLAAAKAGIVEMLLAGAGPVGPAGSGGHRTWSTSAVEAVSIAVDARWPEARPDAGGSAVPPVAALVEPFDSLARKAATAVAGPDDDTVVAHCTPDGTMWASLHLCGHTTAVTVTATTGDVLSSIDHLWLQAMTLCRRVTDPRHVSGRARVQITLHFLSVRLTAAELSEALRVAGQWETIRDQA